MTAIAKPNADLQQPNLINAAVGHNDRAAMCGCCGVYNVGADAPPLREN